MTPNMLNTESKQSVSSSTQRMFDLIQARRKFEEEQMAWQNQLFQDSKADYEKARKAQEEYEAKKEEAERIAARDHQGNAWSGAAMGSSFGPWGALAGGIVGGIMGIGESTADRMEHDGDNFFEAFLPSALDVIPGFNIGAAIVGKDPTKEAYAFREIAQDPEQAMGYVQQFGGNIATSMANNSAKKAPERDTKPIIPEIPDYKLREPQLGDSAKGTTVPATSNMAGDYQLTYNYGNSEPMQGRKKKHTFDLFGGY